ncbi:MAG: porin family protein [Gallionella sp.]
MRIFNPFILLIFGLLSLAGISPTIAAENISPTSHQDSALGNTASQEVYEMLLQQADQLIHDNKPDEAYALLSSNEAEHAGDPRFDYIMGIAALDSGKPDHAASAFERAMAANADFTAARLELGRAYFQLGDFERAKSAFETTLAQVTSEEIRADINGYLDEISIRAAARNTYITGFVGLTVGHDSNFNNSTKEPRVRLFDAQNWVIHTIDPVNMKVSGSYYAAEAGFQIDQDLTSQWGVFASMAYRHRTPFNQATSKTANLDMRAGLQYETHNNLFRVNVVMGKLNSGSIHNSHTSGIYSDWQHFFTPRIQMNVFIQSMQYRYAELLLKPNDMNQQALGIGWVYELDDEATSLFGSMYSGSEKDISSSINVNMPGLGVVTINPGGGRNDGTKTFSGLRIGGQLIVNDKSTLFTDAGFQSGDYGKTNQQFNVKRMDQIYDISLGMNWLWDQSWTISPKFTYLHNESNIDIYTHDRSDVSLTISRDF